MASIQEVPKEVLLPMVESLAQAGFNSLTIALLHHTIRDEKDAPNIINYDTLEQVMSTFDKVAEHHIIEIKDKLLGHIDDEQLSDELTELSISTMDTVKDQIREFVTKKEVT
ncbi:MAG: hypothetical protein JXR12_05705 [Neptunomonas phycophila]|uniref:hypothetical protein n=1 Tax=Neptunomonas phycophila TaxID=1572645 RepID=UPI003B8E303C